MTLSLNHTPRQRSITAVDRAAQAVGYFSIGLGLAELLFPGRLARLLGLDGREGILRAYGVREIASGIAALQPNPGPALWARVAGDVLDLATLAQARDSGDEGKRRNANAALAAVGAITLFDLLLASASTAQTTRAPEARDYSDRSGFPGGIDAARGAMANYTLPDYRASPRIRDERLTEPTSNAAASATSP